MIAGAIAYIVIVRYRPHLGVHPGICRAHCELMAGVAHRRGSRHHSWRLCWRGRHLSACWCSIPSWDADGGVVAAGIFFGAITGAVLWAQWVEGSPSAAAGDSVLRRSDWRHDRHRSPCFSASGWGAVAAFAVAGPWIQAMGGPLTLPGAGLLPRLRHGGAPGIRYTPLRARASAPRATCWRCDTPRHAGVFHSMELRCRRARCCACWAVHAPGMVIAAGIYFLLSGAGGFAEEKR